MHDFLDAHYVRKAQNDVIADTLRGAGLIPSGRAWELAKAREEREELVTPSYARRLAGRADVKADQTAIRERQAAVAAARKAERDAARPANKAAFAQASVDRDAAMKAARASLRAAGLTKGQVAERLRGATLAQLRAMA